MEHTVKPHRLARLPAWFTHWLGYRATPPPKNPEYVTWLWSFIAAFCGISLLQAVFGHARYFIERGAPQIVASYVSRLLRHLLKKVRLYFREPRQFSYTVPLIHRWRNLGHWLEATSLVP